MQPGQRNTTSAREAPAKEAERTSRLQPTYESIVVAIELLLFIIVRNPSERRGRKCDGEQVRPGSQICWVLQVPRFALWDTDDGV